MAGILTHLAISLFGFLIITLIFKKWKYGIWFAVGHVLTDAIKFGIPGIKMMTFSFNRIVASPLFVVLDKYTHTFVYWIILWLVVFGITFLLYKFKEVKRGSLRRINWYYLIFLLGVGVHLIVDLVVKERVYWI